MAFQEILYEVEDSVLTLTLNRPEKLNAVTYRMMDELLEAFDMIDKDDNIRAVIVTGAGRCFSAGTDLSAKDGFKPGDAEFKPLQGRGRDLGGAIAVRIFDCKKPVIAAYNGPAVGIGITMTLPMDVRIGVVGGKFGLPFTRRGIVPESCASWFLPRIVGISRALSWTLSGRMFTADEAKEAGLVEALVPPDQLMPRAREIAREIAANTSAVSVAVTRQLMWHLLGADHPMEANRLETRALLALGTMGDTKEGVAAFREKRAPQFTLRPSQDMPPGFPWWETPEFKP